MVVMKLFCPMNLIFLIKKRNSTNFDELSFIVINLESYKPNQLLYYEFYEPKLKLVYDRQHEPKK